MAKQMTVGQLLKKLQKMDPKAKISVGDMGGMSCGVLTGVYKGGDEVSLEYRETIYNGEILED